MAMEKSDSENDNPPTLISNTRKSRKRNRCGAAKRRASKRRRLVAENESVPNPSPHSPPVEQSSINEIVEELGQPGGSGTPIEPSSAVVPELGTQNVNSMVIGADELKSGSTLNQSGGTIVLSSSSHDSTSFVDELRTGTTQNQSLESEIGTRKSECEVLVPKSDDLPSQDKKPQNQLGGSVSEDSTPSDVHKTQPGTTLNQNQPSSSAESNTSSTGSTNDQTEVLTNSSDNLSEGGNLQNQTEDKVLHVCVVREDFPLREFTEPQQTSLLEKLINAHMTDIENLCPDTPSKFPDYNFSHGALIFTCYDEEAQGWLNRTVIQLQTRIPHIQLTTLEEITKPRRALIHVQGPKVEPDKMLSLLNRVNPGLITRGWEVHSHERDELGYSWLLVKIDVASVDVLRSIKFRPYYVLNRPKIYLLKD